VPRDSTITRCIAIVALARILLIGLSGYVTHSEIRVSAKRSSTSSGASRRLLWRDFLQQVRNRLAGGRRWIRNVGPAPWRGQGRAALLDIRRGVRHGVRCRAFPCSAGRYDRAYPFGGDGHLSTDKLVGASGVQSELRGQIIVRHIWATGELSNPRPSFGCLKCLPTMSSKSSMSTTMCGSKA
jgi:hypothetical protein